MPALLGLLAGIGWGFSDFFGGFWGRRVKPMVMMFYGQTMLLVVYLVLVWIFPSAFSWSAVAWGAFAGIANILAMLIFLESMKLERVAIVTPLSGVMTALTALTVSLVSGENLSVGSLIGIAIALVGVVLVSASSQKEHMPDRDVEIKHSLGGITLALISGPLFAIALVAMHQVPKNAGVMPILFMRVSAPLLFVMAKVRHVDLKVPRRDLYAAVVWSMPSVVALVAFRYAVRGEHLAVPATLASASPIFTAMLAWVIQKEHASRRQVFGVLCATAGIILLSV